MANNLLLSKRISSLNMNERLFKLKNMLAKLELKPESSMVKKVSQSYLPVEVEGDSGLESLPFADPDSKSFQEFDDLLNPTSNKTYEDLFDMQDDGDGVELEKLIELGILTQEEAASDNINWQRREERIKKYKDSLRLQRRYYIRFGNIVDVSQNKLGDQEAVAEMHGMSQEKYNFHKEFETGNEIFYEPGMSAYYARTYGNDKWMIAVDPYNLKDMLDIMEQRIKDGAIYLVTGVQRSLGVGDNPTYGSDTEPLIEDVNIIKKLTIDDVVLPISRSGIETDEFGRIIRNEDTLYEYRSDIPPEDLDDESLNDPSKFKKWRKELSRFKNPYNKTILSYPTLREWLYYHFKSEVKRVYNKDVDNPIEYWYEKVDRQYADWIMSSIIEDGNVEEDFKFDKEEENAIFNFVKNKISDINLVKGKNSWQLAADIVEDALISGNDIEEALNSWHKDVISQKRRSNVNKKLLGLHSYLNKNGFKQEAKALKKLSTPIGDIWEPHCMKNFIDMFLAPYNMSDMKKEASILYNIYKYSISYSQVISDLDSNKLKKRIKNYVLNKEIKKYDNILGGSIEHLPYQQYVSEKYNRLLEIPAVAKEIDDTLSSFKDAIISVIPEETLSDNESALTLLWLIRIYGDKPDQLINNIQNIKESLLSLNIYFKYKKYMKEKDLLKIFSVENLILNIQFASKDIEKEEENVLSKDPEQGKKKIFDGNGYVVYEITGFGSAKDSARGTKWCTNDRDHFDLYCKTDSPLFIFVNKNNPAEKYQFSYVDMEFGDVNNKRISDDKIMFFHSMISNYINENYKFLSTIAPDKTIDEKVESLKEILSDKTKRSMTVYDYLRNMKDEESEHIEYALILRALYYHIPGKFEDGKNFLFVDERLELHNMDGPALYGVGDSLQWFIHGKNHRLDGPAVIYDNGKAFYYLDDILYSKDDYLKEIHKLNS